ncbi:MAG: hypothetical protein CML60_07145 [Rhodobacteraceae bacterium]|nr:hypothetical protein [Paracoccaceae bacterium]
MENLMPMNMRFCSSTFSDVEMIQNFQKRNVASIRSQFPSICARTNVLPVMSRSHQLTISWTRTVDLCENIYRVIFQRTTDGFSN